MNQRRKSPRGQGVGLATKQSSDVLMKHRRAVHLQQVEQVVAYRYQYSLTVHRPIQTGQLIPQRRMQVSWKLRSHSVVRISSFTIWQIYLNLGGITNIQHLLTMPPA